ncbi:aminoglycoside phosphotransferase family protein [Modestobacter marinus]|uniref:Phosphotransferase n=1 Tax=Modestobacter marinus TaxID=477641 RepID=A0A846LPJ5_9ACTN|nr:aminoglycoside phosphotransferase family protein [Modestobacter marinus]NIH69337.1 aminoglycoside phosphotransferase (APT) family kinase protein [Modestobacter marinus]GGL83011.1 phosphotransferase [Modestobacter marinus]
MPRTPMHAGQAPTDAALVRRLVARQFPGWAGLPVRPVASAGTDHDLYRLGGELVVRLPLVPAATGQAAREATWLPRLAPSLPLAVPQPVALGEPDAGYPHAWSVYRWLPGTDARALDGGDRAASELAARDLAAFIRALHRIDTTGAPRRGPGGRGGPLADLDAAVRASVEALGDRVDPVAVRTAWAESVAVPPWSGADVWLHADLLPGNLLLTDGRLSAVIDFGLLTIGDPAVDLLPAWNLFDAAGRAVFLSALGADEAVRLRGRGWALAQAVIALPYYWTTNPGMVAQAQRALAEVLADAG